MFKKRFNIPKLHKISFFFVTVDIDGEKVINGEKISKNSKNFKEFKNNENSIMLYSIALEILIIILLKQKKKNIFSTHVINR